GSVPSAPQSLASSCSRSRPPHCGWCRSLSSSPGSSGCGWQRPRRPLPAARRSFPGPLPPPLPSHPRRTTGVRPLQPEPQQPGPPNQPNRERETWAHPPLYRLDRPAKVSRTGAGSRGRDETRGVMTDEQSAPGTPRDRQLEEANKAIIAGAFKEWAAGTGGPFALLADDVSWTIVGNSPVSRRYESRQEFMDAVIHPFNARMASPLVPTVPSLYAENDWVIALFDAAGTAR